MGREHYLCLGMSRRDVGVVGSDSSRFRRIDRPRKGLIVGTGKSPHTEGKFGRRFIGNIFGAFAQTGIKFSGGFFYFSVGR